MKTSIFTLFVKRFLCVVALAFEIPFHVTPVVAQPTPIGACRGTTEPLVTSGSYVLTGNLTGPAFPACLFVLADFVPSTSPAS